MQAARAPGEGAAVVSEPDVELTLPADPESVVLARQMVRGLIDVLGWSEESRNDISIAVTEACTTSARGSGRSGWSLRCATTGGASPRASSRPRRAWAWASP